MLNWLKSLGGNKRGKKRVDERGVQADDARDQKGEHGRSRKPKKSKGRAKGRAKHGTAAAAASASNQAHILSRAEHGISRNDIDEHALKVLYRLHKAGYHACLVGGAVRDLLLGIVPKDFDVATDATPEQVNKLFRNCRLIGRRFRLAHIHFGKQIIEVATFRANHDFSQSGQQDESGRIVRDNVFGELADDVWRRDFTINALYYDIADFSVIDFVGGYDDIKARRLNLIGDVETRYREDPVRMLRAVRFAAKLDFEIDAHCSDPIYEFGHLLQDIPPARLYEEALKLFHSGHAVKSFDTLLEYDLLQYLFPEAATAVGEDDVFKRMLVTAMENTDLRIRKDLRVTPAFLFAALLWRPVDDEARELVASGMPHSVAIQKAATKVLSRQSASISIPKRFTTVMRDIWGMQSRFHYRGGKRALGVLEHKKFRAAYDFLCIRAQAGEVAENTDLEADCQWWTDIQKQDAEKQRGTLLNAPNKKSGKRRRRRRKPSAAKAGSGTDKAS